MNLHFGGMGNQTVNSSQINSSRTITASVSSQSMAFGIFVEAIILWTMIGNIIIISVLKLYKPLTIPDILVFSLALSDLLNVLLPAHILNLIQSRMIEATWNKPMCIAFTWCVHCFRLSSVLTVSVIAIDRLIAIRKPLVYRARVMHEIGRVKILILLLWLFSCLTASLPYMGLPQSPFKNNQCHYQLFDLGPYYGFFVEILGLLQLALVLYCYIAIRISTWHFMQRQGRFRRQQLDKTVLNPAHSVQEKARKALKAVDMKRHLSQTELTGSDSREETEGAPSFEHKEKRGSFIKHFGSKRRGSNAPMLTEGMKQVAKMEKMMIVLVLLFYLSWLPFLGSNLFTLITGRSKKGVTAIIGVFSLINGILNPIVYATIYPRYRKGYIFVFQTILRLCGGKKPSLTTADFDSSKIGRSKRLRTLKEMKSNVSMVSTSTLKEVEAPQVRCGWTNTTAGEPIPEELIEVAPGTLLKDVGNSALPGSVLVDKSNSSSTNLNMQKTTEENCGSCFDDNDECMPEVFNTENSSADLKTRPCRRVVSPRTVRLKERGCLECMTESAEQEPNSLVVCRSGTKIDSGSCFSNYAFSDETFDKEYCKTPERNHLNRDREIEHRITLSSSSCDDTLLRDRVTTMEPMAKCGSRQSSEFIGNSRVEGLDHINTYNTDTMPVVNGHSKICALPDTVEQQP